MYNWAPRRTLHVYKSSPEVFLDPYQVHPRLFACNFAHALICMVAPSSVAPPSIVLLVEADKWQEVHSAIVQNVWNLGTIWSYRRCQDTLQGLSQGLK